MVGSQYGETFQLKQQMFMVGSQYGETLPNSDGLFSFYARKEFPSFHSAALMVSWSRPGHQV